MAAFKTKKLFLPSKVQEMMPSSEDVDSLRAFPFLDNPTLMIDLKGELPTYVSKANGVSSKFDVLSWWENHSQELPCWTNAALRVLLVHPSSVAAERVFSLLSNYFGDQQQNCLEDYVEASLMFQYMNVNSFCYCLSF